MHSMSRAMDCLQLFIRMMEASRQFLVYTEHELSVSTQARNGGECGLNYTKVSDSVSQVEL